MSDRIDSFVVYLDADLKDEDAAHLEKAIRMLKHVISVESNVVDLPDWRARTRIRHELELKLLEVLYPKKEQA